MDAHPTWTPLSGAPRRVALEVLLDGPLARSELSRRLGLSPGSLTRLTRPLVDSGLLVELAPVEATLGRPTRPLAVVPSSHHFVGVKLTGDHAYGAVTDLRATVVVAEDTALTATDPDAVVDVVTDLVRRLVSRLADARPGAGVTGLGVSLGGHVADQTTVTHASHLGWDDVPLAARLGRATGLRTVVENDVVALTEATHWFGEGHGSDRFALVTIGAGIGYGLVVHDSAVTSPEAGHSLLSHFPVAPAGPPGPCGHHGCATSMLTIGSLVSRAAERLGRPVTYDQLLDLAAAGDPPARALVDESGAALGRMLAAVANLTMPERIVLGGEGVRLATVAHDALLAGLRSERDPHTAVPRIELQSPELALWARGAAVVAIQAFVLGKEDTAEVTR
ncbi:ROK family transcriptional regulator [Sanguibacter suaedae]|uniref:ROK family transcriptional regulator n=1 Tax=Sanguibacter suaedae TaxID=2795737 RepID=A0A934M7Z9_9MICO|nr:ROK family transcriptional regulator [Sanguibacter suaedae]MBI9115992.1 ROK family transcriptional regulator [Sanguibacter suaedae]